MLEQAVEIITPFGLAISLFLIGIVHQLKLLSQASGVSRTTGDKMASDL